MVRVGKKVVAAAAHRLFELPVRKVTNGISTPPNAIEQSLEAQQTVVLAGMAIPLGVAGLKSMPWRMR